MSKIKIATYSKTCKSLEETVVNRSNRKVVVRMGGTMNYSDYPIQINSKEGTEMSIDKFRFNANALHTLPTLLIHNVDSVRNLVRNEFFYLGREYFQSKRAEREYILKPIHSAGGADIYIVNLDRNSLGEIESMLLGLINQSPYIVQPLVKVTSEYRVHVSSTGDTKVTKKVKYDENDRFIKRKNHKVLDIAHTVKPRRLNDIISACQQNARMMNMDLLCFDVIYDSSNKDNHSFYIVESNTGPELIGTTKDFYKEQIEKLIQIKTA